MDPLGHVNAEILPARAWPRGLMIAIGIAAVLVAALGIRAFDDVFAPVFLGLVLSITVQPLRRLPVRHGLPAWVGTALSLVAVYAMVAGLVAILLLSGLQLAGLLDDYAPQFQAMLADLGAALQNLGVSQAQLEAAQAALSPSRLIDLVIALLGGVAGILSSVAFLVLAVVLHRDRCGHVRGQPCPAVPGWPALGRGLPTVRPRQSAVPRSIDDLRRGRRPPRRHRPDHPRHPLRMAMGPAGLHHQLHPQCRFPDRTAATDDHRAARSRRQDGPRGGHHLLRSQHRHPERHPATGGRHHGWPVRHPQLSLPARLEHNSGRCRRISRGSRHLVGQGPVRRRRPRTAMGESAALQLRRGWAARGSHAGDQSTDG